MPTVANGAPAFGQYKPGPEPGTLVPWSLQVLNVSGGGLAGIMLKTMEESAEHCIESHGGEAWKAFARALWAEERLRGIDGYANGAPGE